MTDNERQIWENRLTIIVQEEALNPLGRIVRHPLKRLTGLGFSKFIYPFTHQGLLTKATTFWGEKLIVKLPGGLDIYLTGAKVHPSEIRLARYFINRVKPGMTLIDVGAHFGFYSRLFMYLTGNEGNVYAFEPSPKTFEVLKANTIDKMMAMQMAVSATPGSTRFLIHDIAASEANRVAQENDNVDVVDVEMVSLDSFCQTNNVTPDIIKMDVEGHEAESITGSLQLLSQTKPDVILEIFNPAHVNHRLHQPALKLMFDAGYLMYKIDKTGRAKAVAEIDEVFVNDRMETENVLFLPKQY